MTFENFVYVSILLFFATIAFMGMVENRKQTHYWRGRKDGWDMHRRMMQTKTEKVFNYDDYK